LKRLNRNPEKFEPLELYDAIGRNLGYKLNVAQNRADFIKRIDESIKAASENSALIHGKRVEAMFAHVAGGLGQCAFIKQEDAGDVFADNDQLQAPDYRIVLKSGEQFFVEVKNSHYANPNYLYPISKDYDAKLQAYAKLNRIPLKYAIYHSKWNKWTLLSRDSFIEQKKRYVTDLVNALARNEMLTLDDRMISTEPDLIFELRADPSKEVSLSPEGYAQFTIGDVKMYCNRREITNAQEKSIAFYLMRFGDWPEGDIEAVYVDNKFVGVKHTFSPENFERSETFSLIGTLSSMISAAYSERTVQEKDVVALGIKEHPEIFAPEIPLDYKGVALPLWQFLVQPNPEPIVRKTA